MKDTHQFVIMFNDYPEEVCTLETTQRQAEERAKQIKEEYMKRNGMKDSEGARLHVRPMPIPVFKP